MAVNHSRKIPTYSRPGISVRDPNEKPRMWGQTPVGKLVPGDVLPNVGMVTAVEVTEEDWVTVVCQQQKAEFLVGEKVFAFSRAAE